ncbi:MAG: DNA adenine methylase [Acidimicrobiaceae bacterium]|nr:DNA adenine methylase [Acidimicrobiaceae bacterium]MYE96876.1 DNA adenine methylase [Acidimicrobiaceae bacterium]MYI53768.1 DNA adenine methylase [Acidimicrobiaceae bacterium]
MAFHSPLRYPGGKGLLLRFVREIVRRNTPPATTYVEPFAGGAAVAVGLLLEGDIDAAVIGDADPAIAAFWRAAVNHPDQFADRISECAVTIDTWHEQAEILSRGPTGDDLTLGFAAFFLNRTNYSGVIRARPIGGLNQDGRWPLDCRFNKPNLLERLEAIAGLAGRLDIHEGDAIDLLTQINAHTEGSALVYADPPYLTKSSDLYMDTMTYASHQELAHTLQSSATFWMVSYDTDERVANELYPEARILRFSLRHSASRAHRGQELIAFSRNCVVGTATTQLVGAKWLDRSNSADAV